MRDLEYMLERISLWEKLPVLLLDAEDQVIPWRDNILDVEGWYGENPDLMDLLLHYLNGHRQTIIRSRKFLPTPRWRTKRPESAVFSALLCWKRIFTAASEITAMWGRTCRRMGSCPVFLWNI